MTFLMDWIPGFGAALVLTLAGLVLWARLRHRAAKRDARDQTEHHPFAKDEPQACH